MSNPSTSQNNATASSNHLRPKQTYVQLIRTAIIDSPRQALTLQEIYDSIESKHPFFTTAKTGWKNTTRHCLSLNPCFVNAARPFPLPGKGGYWTVDLTQPESFTRKRAKALKASKDGNDNDSPSPVRATSSAPRTSRRRKNSFEGPSSNRPRISSNSSNPRGDGSGRNTGDESYDEDDDDGEDTGGGRRSLDDGSVASGSRGGGSRPPSRGSGPPPVQGRTIGDGGFGRTSSTGPSSASQQYPPPPQQGHHLHEQYPSYPPPSQYASYNSQPIPYGQNYGPGGYYPPPQHHQPSGLDHHSYAPRSHSPNSLNSPTQAYHPYQNNPYPQYSQPPHPQHPHQQHHHHAPPPFLPSPYPPHPNQPYPTTNGHGNGNGNGNGNGSYLARDVAKSPLPNSLSTIMNPSNASSHQDLDLGARQLQHHPRDPYPSYPNPSDPSTINYSNSRSYDQAPAWPGPPPFQGGGVGGGGGFAYMPSSSMMRDARPSIGLGMGTGMGMGRGEGVPTSGAREEVSRVGRDDGLGPPTPVPVPSGVVADAEARRVTPSPPPPAPSATSQVD